MEQRPEPLAAPARRPARGGRPSRDLTVVHARHTLPRRIASRGKEMPTSSASGAVRRAIDDYFAGERRDALVFMLLGAANLGAALAVLLAVPGQRLLALALATIGVLELVPGSWALRRQMTRHGEALARQRVDPEGWRAAESARLQRVLHARKRLRIADAIF